MLLLACPLFAKADPSGDTLDRILEALADDPPSHIDFRETREDPLLEFPETRTGTLVFEPPDTLERRMDGDGGERVRIEGRQVVVERRGSSREVDLDEQPGLAAFAALFRSLARGEREGLEEHFEVETEGDLEDWRLELTPRDRTLRRMILGLELQGEGGALLRLDTEESGGRHSRMQLDPRDGD
ncbi:LolA-related protein [Thioalkalivibrio thiocyanoxidans]|uniref:LolA-related protein n=1 Tax=Thioalkalivibrio thiocyanoxidans TaxID=152475 RepID=UPI0004773DC2|nr:LolA-related protein [Thioalkalivibrio thiocyanoxidans]